MASFDEFENDSRFLFALQEVGEEFLKVQNCVKTVKRFVYGESPEEVKEKKVLCAEEIVFSNQATSVVEIYPDLSKSAKKQFKEFHEFCLDSGMAMGTVFVSKREKCRICSRVLGVEKDYVPVVVYHNVKGTYLGCRVTKFCRHCKINEHYGFWSSNGQKQYDLESVLQGEFVLSTENTAFDMDLLKSFSSLLVVGALPFSTFAESYNKRFGYNKKKKEADPPRFKRAKRENSLELKELLRSRECLDRRRFEEGFLLYAVIEVMSKYGITSSHMPCDRNSLVEMVTNSYHEAFVKKWGDHECDKNGCKNVIVLDGNMKNCRQVCSLKNALELKFEYLDGSISIGCLNTPLKGQRLCGEHAETACIFKDDLQESGKPLDTSEVIPLKVLNTKETRSDKFYEVLWSDSRTSWVKESNMPKNVGSIVVNIKEFGQMRRELRSNTTTGDDLVKSAFTSSGFGVELIEDNEFVVDGVMDSKTCETEKGKHKSKNMKSAGILVFEKPCGIAIDVKEMYGSESKSQVYGHLHELLSKQNMKCIDVICYDDACHLKMFSQNPLRKDANDTSKKLATMDIVCDRFHFKNHVGQWCKKNCDPYSCTKLKDVNTEVCEQLFSWLSKFSPITKHMNRHRFMFLMLYVLDQHNEDNC